MLNDMNLDALYNEVAESIAGPQGNSATKEDMQALAQMIQQVPQMVPVADPSQVIGGLIAQIANLSQEVRSLRTRMESIEDKQPSASDVYKPVLNELKKTKTKTVIFEVQTDNYGFPEKVIAKEKIER